MKKRFVVLDVFRGLFAIMVFFFHLRHTANLDHTVLLQNNLVNNSALFVDFFFVLSGFVIAYNYTTIINSFNQYKDFAIKRFRRIYPLHVFMLLVFVVVIGSKIILKVPWHNADDIKQYSIEGFFTNLLLLNAVKLPGIETLTWNSPSWSISAEWFCYLLFGLLILLLSKSKIKQSLIVIFSVVIVAASICLSGLFDGHAVTGGVNLLGTHTNSFYNGFLRGFSGFFLGVICNQVYSKTNTLSANKILFTGLEALSFILIILAVSYAPQINNCLSYEGVFCLSILVFSREAGLISSTLKKSKLLLKLGDLSYSIYMTHLFVVMMTTMAFKRLHIKNHILQNVTVLALLGVVCLISYFTYNYIEKRFYKKQAGKRVDAGLKEVVAR